MVDVNLGHGAALQTSESPGDQPGQWICTSRYAACETPLGYAVADKSQDYIWAKVVRAEGSGLEPQWLVKPLGRFAGGVQYPLEIPSRRTVCAPTIYLPRKCLTVMCKVF